MLLCFKQWLKVFQRVIACLERKLGFRWSRNLTHALLEAKVEERELTIKLLSKRSPFHDSQTLKPLFEVKCVLKPSKMAEGVTLNV
jgi:hypothetical protein